jgi:hypothetical protein
MPLHNPKELKIGEGLISFTPISSVGIRIARLSLIMKVVSMQYLQIL